MKDLVQVEIVSGDDRCCDRIDLETFAIASLTELTTRSFGLAPGSFRIQYVDGGDLVTLETQSELVDVCHVMLANGVKKLQFYCSHCQWIELLDADGYTLNDEPTAVHVLAQDVDALRGKTYRRYATAFLRGIPPNDLTVFRDRSTFDDKTKLGSYDSIATMGTTREDPMSVHAPVPASRRPLDKCLLRLDNTTELKAECVGLLQWQVGVAYPIAQIHVFVHRLGTCTRNGRLFWREEERQVSRILLGEWFDPDSSLSSTRENGLVRQRAIRLQFSHVL